MVHPLKFPEHLETAGQETAGLGFFYKKAQIGSQDFVLTSRFWRDLRVLIEFLVVLCKAP